MIIKGFGTHDGRVASKNTKPQIGHSHGHTFELRPTFNSFKTQSNLHTHLVDPSCFAFIRTVSCYCLRNIQRNEHKRECKIARDRRSFSRKSRSFTVGMHVEWYAPNFARESAVLNTRKCKMYWILQHRKESVGTNSASLGLQTEQLFFKIHSLIHSCWTISFLYTIQRTRRFLNRWI